MPSFQGRTPEALLGRNDSKNAATTCRGITTSGRPCRRALAALSQGKKKAGVVAIVEEDDEVKDAEFYCYQHKDQAEQKATEPVPFARRKTQLYPLTERRSVDTLVQRLGVEGVGSDISAAVRPKRKDRPSRPPGRDTIPEQTQAPYAEKYDFHTPPQRRPKQKKSSFWSLLCCVFDHNDDDYVEVVRHKKRIEGSRPQDTSSRLSNSTTPQPPSGTSRPSSTSVPGTRPSSTLPLRPSPQTHHTPSSKSQTGQLLSLIPQHLSPQTTSALLAELSKPPNPNDEDGYIYIFWLTPQTAPTPPESAARSLLVPESPSRPRPERRISDVLTEFSFTGSSERDINGGSKTKKTILLKIGRANNVHRRMTEWQRQCGYALTLVRWYPYISSSSTPPSPATSPSPRPPNRQRPQPQLYPDLSATAGASRPSASRRDSGAVRKVACVKRVERLIHLELAERQAKQRCDVCGREHKEWFEVDASEKGVKAVDEIVRRWVGWGEQQVG